MPTVERNMRRRLDWESVRGCGRDLARAARLLRRDPGHRSVPPRPERIVVTLSTVPQRVRHLRPILRSLLDQTMPADRVVLAWPTHSLRTGQPYPAPPDLPRGVELLRCQDVGPATKLLPVLRAEPDAAIVVVDDDYLCPQDFLATLLAAHRASPDAAVGIRGQLVGRCVTDSRYPVYVHGMGLTSPQPVDALMGMWGYLIPPRALDDAVHDFGGWPEEMRWQDDIWISGHLARRGVERLVVPISGNPVRSPNTFSAALHHTVNRSGHNERIAKETFRNWWQPA